jgi:hypothetical protein
VNNTPFNLNNKLILIWHQLWCISRKRFPYDKSQCKPIRKRIIQKFGIQLIIHLSVSCFIFQNVPQSASARKLIQIHITARQILNYLESDMRIR